MLTSARKPTNAFQPTWAVCPAILAIVTGPLTPFHETVPTIMLPSIFRLSTEISQVLPTACVIADKGEYRTSIMYFFNSSSRMR